jgi:5-methylcytosine-specific restriction endonuclease McrA
LNRQKFESRKIRLVVLALEDRALTELVKACTKCGTEKSLSLFSKNIRNKDGLKFQCKACDKTEIAAHREKCPEKAKASHASYYAKNSEVIRKKRIEYYRADPQRAIGAAAAWRLNNAEKAKATTDAYRKANREVILERTQSWRAANPDAIKAYSAAYARANPEVLRAKWATRRARKRNAEGSYTANDIKELLALQRGRCAYCKCKIKDKFHVDHHIPLARAGKNSKENLQILCATCNLKKGAKDPIDFVRALGFLL